LGFLDWALLEEDDEGEDEEYPPRLDKGTGKAIVKGLNLIPMLRNPKVMLRKLATDGVNMRIDDVVQHNDDTKDYIDTEVLP
jgi:hypothetical protein